MPDVPAKQRSRQAFLTARDPAEQQEQDFGFSISLVRSVYKFSNDDLRDMDESQLAAYVENAQPLIRFFARTAWNALVESIAAFVVKLFKR